MMTVKPIRSIEIIRATSVRRFGPFFIYPFLFCFMILASGCANSSLWSGAGHSEIQTTMQAWADGWKLMDQKRLEPLLDESYVGIFEETKPVLLRFASKHHGEEKTSVRLTLDQMEIKVKGRTAMVRNIHCTGQLEPGWTIDLVIDYSLRKDGDVWRITQATWNQDTLDKKEEDKAGQLADSNV